MRVVARKLPEPGEAPAKRGQIVDAACRLFLENGYVLSSMDSVTTEASVSKRIIYSYLQNNESPFNDIMGYMSHLFGEGALNTINFDGPSDKFIRESARFVISKVTNPNAQSPGPDAGDHHPGRQFPRDGGKALGNQVERFPERGR